MNQLIYLFKMNTKEKELYLKVKRKHILNCVRIVKRLFNEHHVKLSNRPVKEQGVIGDFLTVLEMELKKELKKNL